MTIDNCSCSPRYNPDCAYMKGGYCSAPEEITSAEMDAIEAAAIAGKPIQSMDIWQAYAAAQDEIAALKAANASGDVRAAVIAECALVCKAHAKWAEGQIDQDPASTKSQLFATISNTADDCAAMVRAVAQSPATDAAAKRDEIAKAAWNWRHARVGGDFETAVGTVAYADCINFADDILVLGGVA